MATRALAGAVETERCEPDDAAPALLETVLGLPSAFVVRGAEPGAGSVGILADAGTGSRAGVTVNLAVAAAHGRQDAGAHARSRQANRLGTRAPAIVAHGIGTVLVRVAAPEWTAARASEQAEAFRMARDAVFHGVVLGHAAR